MASLKKVIKKKTLLQPWKVMFVGEEHVGKTSVLQGLRKKPTDTFAWGEGITTEYWLWDLNASNSKTKQQALLAVWDFRKSGEFGLRGQDNYQVVQETFASHDRCIYVIVWDLTNSYSQKRIEHWLYSINIHSRKAPIILVGTHKDDARVTDEHLKQLSQVLKDKFNKTFRNIRATVYVDCVSGGGLPDVKESLAKIVDDDAAKHSSNQLYAAAQLLEAVAGLAKKRMPPLIPFDTYNELASKYLTDNKEDGNGYSTVAELTALLGDLGALVHIPQDARMNHVVIADPKWLYKMIDTIVQSRHKNTKKGIFYPSTLQQLWLAPEYPEDIHPLLLSLLDRFGISFCIRPIDVQPNDLDLLDDKASGGEGAAENSNEKGQYYFIPSILPEEKPIMFSYMRKVFAEFDRETDKTLKTEEKEQELTLEVSLNSHIERWNKPDTDVHVEGEGDADADTIPLPSSDNSSSSQTSKKKKKEKKKKKTSKVEGESQQTNGQTCDIETLDCLTEQTNFELSDDDVDWDSGLDENSERLMSPRILHSSSMDELSLSDESAISRSAGGTPTMKRASIEVKHTLLRINSGRQCNSESSDASNGDKTENDPSKKEKKKEKKAKKEKKEEKKAKKEKKENPQRPIKRSGTIGLGEARRLAQINSSDATASSQAPTQTASSASAPLPTVSDGDVEEQGEVYQFGRMYHFAFMPNGFFGRLMARVLVDGKFEPQVYWRTGMLLAWQKRASRRGREEKILVEILPSENRISIQVRKQISTNWMAGKAKDEPSSMVVIIHTIDALVEDWYQTKKMSKVTVPCIHCLRDTVKQAYHFSIETCQRALIHNRLYLRCPRGKAQEGDKGTPVRISALAPDLAMCHLQSSRVKYEDIQFGTPLGEGAYSLVYRGTLKDGTEVAIKKLKNPLRSFEEFRREIWMMRGLHHPNLLALRGYTLNPCCVVLELMKQGDLFQFVHRDEWAEQRKKVEKWWPLLMLKIAKDIAKGCAFLHSANPPVIHRDLKSPNVLLLDISKHASVVAKVSDFGTCQQIAGIATGRKVENPVWLAPEVMKDKIYTEKADIYSFGVILYEMLTHKQFFEEERFFSKMEQKIIAGERPQLPQCYPELEQLIRECWASDAGSRPSFVSIIDKIVNIMKIYFPKHVNYDADHMSKHGLAMSGVVDWQQLDSISPPSTAPFNSLPKDSADASSS